MILAGTFALHACATFSEHDAAADTAARQALARAVAETAGRVAVSKPGAKVCRQIMVGISERDWVRGTVIEVGADRINVRIDDPGRFPQAADGLARGATSWETPLHWIPCT
jgi:hypothetical protein